MPAANTSCLVLVPLFGQIAPRCEDGFLELERLGDRLLQALGIRVVHQGPSQMASDELHRDLAETMWIDPDIGFEANDVDRLRSHGLPLVCGIYPQTAGRSLACHLLPRTG